MVNSTTRSLKLFRITNQAKIEKNQDPKVEDRQYKKSGVEKDQHSDLDAFNGQGSKAYDEIMSKVRPNLSYIDQYPDFKSTEDEHRALIILRNPHKDRVEFLHPKINSGPLESFNKDSSCVLPKDAFLPLAG